jgi:hypothetical protein
MYFSWNVQTGGNGPGLKVDFDRLLRAVAFV